MDLLGNFHDELDNFVADVTTAASPYLDKVAAPGSLARAYVAIVAIGLLFWFVELAMLLLLKPLLVKVLRQPANSKTDAKTQLRKADATATQTIARIVGSIHNGIQVPLGLLILRDWRFRDDRVYASTKLSYAVCYISAGYFLHDLVMCALRFSLEGPLYTIHALSCHMAYTFGAATGFLHYHGAAFLMWEISTPFVHTRWFMYKAGLANTAMYVINGVLMIIAFCGCRIVWGYYQSYYLVTDVVGEQLRGGSFPMAATVGYCLVAVVMNSLNTHWFYKMMVAALAVFIKGKKAAEVGSHKDE